MSRERYFTSSQITTEIILAAGGSPPESRFYLPSYATKLVERAGRHVRQQLGLYDPNSKGRIRYDSAQAKLIIDTLRGFRSRPKMQRNMEEAGLDNPVLDLTEERLLPEPH